MATIKMEQANAGMIVAVDVKDRSGRVLVRSGAEITDKHIKMLKTWGIRFIEIVTEDHEVEHKLVINIDPARLAEATDIAKSLFQHTEHEHPAIKELIALSIQRIAQKLGTNTHGA
ncbi:conserved hypothetical protein [Gammaproteobacteria bacterium]